MNTSTIFEIVTTSAGAISIRDNVTGETMHNPVGPWAEANALYIEQSHLARRLTEKMDTDLTVFDVGLGAAANALAVLHCARNLPSHRRLKLISFERDLTLLRFALDHADQFAHFAGFEDAVETILTKDFWSDGRIEWTLRRGDYLDLIVNEPTRADLIFFDPYSPKKNVDMWSTESFERTYAKCSPNGCLLYTYSQSTPVRTAMFLAGFYVGAGDATGLKEETTQASVRLEDLAKPYPDAWLGRWSRSHAPLPPGASIDELPVIGARLRAHPQFNKLAGPLVPEQRDFR